MESVLSVKMLAVLTLVLLASSVSQGRIMRKCELKAQLKVAQLQVISAMGNNMTVDDLIARLVCKANGSNFNTSFVREENRPTQALPQAFPKARIVVPARRNQGTWLWGKVPKWPTVWRLFGVFQLSEQLACGSGKVPSLNVCKMNCTALVDDDITDDIACLKTLINSVKPSRKPFGITLLLSVLDTLLVRECRSVVPLKYFAECV